MPLGDLVTSLPTIAREQFGHMGKLTVRDTVCGGASGMPAREVVMRIVRAALMAGGLAALPTAAWAQTTTSTSAPTTTTTAAPTTTTTVTRVEDLVCSEPVNQVATCVDPQGRIVTRVDEPRTTTTTPTTLGERIIDRIVPTPTTVVVSPQPAPPAQPAQPSAPRQLALTG